VLLVGFIAFTINGGGSRPAADVYSCDAGLSGGVGLAGAGGRAGTTAATLSDEQRANAATIIGVARDLGAPPRAWLVALATAMQESTLRNIDYGDRDSLGLFQQRPSQGWGSPAQVTDPVYSTTIFIERLLEVPGWERMPVTVAAQTVQRSAFPDAYAKWEGLAADLVTQLADVADPAGCGRTAVLAEGVAGTAIAFALGEVGKPYLWGGTGPDRYDCSGLLLRAWQAAGINLPRVSRQQFYAGGHLPVRQMQPGDLVLYYHSVSEKQVVGVAEVAATAAPDATAEAGSGWVAVHLTPRQPLARPVSLARIKQDERLRQIGLLRQSRLSVMPLKAAEFDAILELGA